MNCSLREKNHRWIENESRDKCCWVILSSRVLIKDSSDNYLIHYTNSNQLINNNNWKLNFIWQKRNVSFSVWQMIILFSFTLWQDFSSSGTLSFFPLPSWSFVVKCWRQDNSASTSPREQTEHSMSPPLRVSHSVCVCSMETINMQMQWNIPKTR